MSCGTKRRNSGSAKGCELKYETDVESLFDSGCESDYVPNSDELQDDLLTAQTRYYHSIFGKTMSTARFELILRFLCFYDSDTDPTKSKLHKIDQILPYLLAKGRLSSRQYIKNKRHRYGIKLYELCTHDGFILNIHTNTGKNTVVTPGKGHAFAMVTRLMEEFLGQGHSLFLDNYYNSSNVCGALQINRKGNPVDVTGAKKGNITVLKWRDRRNVLMISSTNGPQMTDVVTRRGTVERKPVVVVAYNTNLGGLDRSDQMISYYSTPRKNATGNAKARVLLTKFVAAGVDAPRSVRGRPDAPHLFHIAATVVSHNAPHQRAQLFGVGSPRPFTRRLAPTACRSLAWLHRITTDVGAAVAEWLDCSPPTKVNRFQSPVGGFFLGAMTFLPPLHSSGAPFSARLALIGSQNIAVRSRPNFPTQQLRLNSPCRNHRQERQHNNAHPATNISWHSTFGMEAFAVYMLCRLVTTPEIDRIRLGRASQKQSSDTYKTPLIRVKRCQERKINIEVSECVNVDVFTRNKRPCHQHRHAPLFYVMSLPDVISLLWKATWLPRGHVESQRHVLPTTSSGPVSSSLTICHFGIISFHYPRAAILAIQASTPRAVGEGANRGKERQTPPSSRSKTSENDIHLHWEDKEPTYVKLQKRVSVRGIATLLRRTEDWSSGRTSEFEHTESCSVQSLTVRRWTTMSLGCSGRRRARGCDSGTCRQPRTAPTGGNRKKRVRGRLVLAPVRRGGMSLPGRRAVTATFLRSHWSLITGPRGNNARGVEGLTGRALYTAASLQQWPILGDGDACLTCDVIAARGHLLRLAGDYEVPQTPLPFVRGAIALCSFSFFRGSHRAIMDFHFPPPPKRVRERELRVNIVIHSPSRAPSSLLSQQRGLSVTSREGERVLSRRIGTRP
ncbi:hypothetical protein PR048_018348 [Dryococelus australis]|uniref:PiggyBac transposable element-derived protein domain-containing protein n=1 Tax=Dryococelus australis TaxID=614101 RepID=A0ABQ9HC15_9NEOP|nr:hypothetical protein PR048_018348 [Dryococelus australis]